MNSKKLISLVTILLIILNMIIPTLSLALDAGVVEVKVVTSKTEVKRGEEITVSVNLNTNSVKGINGLQIYMNYDPNVLEPVGNPVRDLPPQSPNGGFEDFGSTTINTNTNSLNFIWSTSSKTITLDYNGSLCTATFKVKEDATLGTSTLQIEELPNVVSGLDENEEAIKIPFTLVAANLDVIMPVNSISLDKTEIDLTVPEEETVNVIYNPENTTQKEIAWETSNKNVATVESTEDGVATIKSVGKGTATITATAENGATAECTVNVTKLVPIESVKLNKEELALDRGSSEQLIATAMPTDTTDDTTIKWTSSKEEVAKVAQDGTVTAVDKGTAIITATSTNGKTAECVVTVGVPLESISFEENMEYKKLNKGDDFDLVVVYNPEDTDTDKAIEWTSSDTSVVSVVDVDGKGKVTAIGAG